MKKCIQNTGRTMETAFVHALGSTYKAVQRALLMCVQRLVHLWKARVGRIRLPQPIAADAWCAAARRKAEQLKRAQKAQPASSRRPLTGPPTTNLR